jgi:hypothetical protein
MYWKVTIFLLRAETDWVTHRIRIAVSSKAANLSYHIPLSEVLRCSVTAILSSTPFPLAQRSELEQKQHDLSLQEKHVHILEGYIIHIHSRDTLSSDFTIETQKKIICTSDTRVYISSKKKIYIHSRNNYFKIFTHEKKTL